MTVCTTTPNANIPTTVPNTIMYIYVCVCMRDVCILDLMAAAVVDWYHYPEREREMKKPQDKFVVQNLHVEEEMGIRPWVGR